MNIIIDNIKSIFNNIYNSIRVHFIRTKEYSKLINHNKELHEEIMKTNHLAKDLWETNKKLKDENNKLKKELLTVKKKYVAEIERYYQFFSTLD